MKYESDQLRMDLGYASTVHKSQGAQYKSVILNLQCAHAIMLMCHRLHSNLRAQGFGSPSLVNEKRCAGQSCNKSRPAGYPSGAKNSRLH